MNEWKSWLKTDPTEWLLEEKNPSVCYFTLTDIWGKPQTNPEVRKAEKAIMERGVVPKILAKQKEDGFGISQDRQSGGFSYLGTSNEGGFHHAVLPCLTGNMVWSLIKFGYLENPMQEAIDLILSKQDDQGRWTLEETFNGRFQVNIEQKGKPSKWVTLNALRVLKNYVNILNL